MLQAAEQRTLDARQNLAAVERLKDTCPRTSHGTGPSKLLQTCERSSSSCCNAVVFEHHTRCPDIQQTSIRILEDENQQLAGSVEDLKHRMQVLFAHFPHNAPCVCWTVQLLCESTTAKLFHIKKQNLGYLILESPQCLVLCHELVAGST